MNTLKPSYEELEQRVSVLEKAADDAKRLQSALIQSEANYRQLFENAPVGIYRFDFRNGKFLQVNDVFRGYLGYTEEEISTLRPYDVLTDESKIRFLERVKKMAQGVEVPPTVEYEVLAKDGRRLDVLLINKNIYDEQGHIIASDVVVNDITERKRADRKLQQTLESLKKAVGVTIEVLVSVLESKDPYTAGHQSRVVHLACAIAAQMGLAADRIDGIRMAGAIHDIGKISIPSEILTKPTRLSDIEFTLIKEHAQTGYEILGNVESPWPLAQIIYQHHERINGSGYPRGLKGDEILLEARIMAVADVVEAMAYDRPYRPALGIEAAHSEINKNRGILFDELVVDACLTLFRDKGYQLQEQHYNGRKVGLNIAGS